MHALYFTSFVLCLFFIQLTHLSTKTYEPPKLRLNRTDGETYEEDDNMEENAEGNQENDIKGKQAKKGCESNAENKSKVSTVIGGSKSFWNIVFPFLLRSDDSLLSDVVMPTGSKEANPKFENNLYSSCHGDCESKKLQEESVKFQDHINEKRHYFEKYEQDYIEHEYKRRMSGKMDSKKGKTKNLKDEYENIKKITKFCKKYVKHFQKRPSFDSSDDESLDLNASYLKCFKKQSSKKYFSSFKNHKSQRFKKNGERHNQKETKFTERVFYENPKDTSEGVGKDSAGDEDGEDSKPNKRRASIWKGSDERILHWKTREGRKYSGDNNKHGKNNKEGHGRNQKNANNNRRGSERFDDTNKQNDKFTDGDDNDDDDGPYAKSRRSGSRTDFKRERLDDNDDDKHEEGEEDVDDDHDEDDGDGHEEDIEQEEMEDLSEKDDDDRRRKKKKKKKKKKPDKDGDGEGGNGNGDGDDSDDESSENDNSEDSSSGDGYESDDDFDDDGDDCHYDDTSELCGTANEGDIYIDDDYHVENGRW